MLRFGRRPRLHGRPAIPLGAILTASALAGTVPPHPAQEDYLSGVAKLLQMLGNDRYGDCAAVCWANWRLLLTALLSGRPGYPTFDQVEQVYKTQNPGFPADDDRMVLQLLLEWLAKHDAPDGSRLVGFAEVNVKNRAELDAGLAIFGGVWLGIEVQQQNMTDFQQGRPWDYRSGDPVVGGHAVLAGGYNADGSLRIATWGAETSLTPRFLDHLLEEAWIPIGAEHTGTTQFEQGIDQSALAAAYLAITGRPFPAAPPPPPAEGLADLVREFYADAEVAAWLASHRSGENHAIQKKLVALKAAAGL